MVPRILASWCPGGPNPGGLTIRDQTAKLPHVYFSWTEGNPIVNVLRYLIFGDGEVAPSPERCCATVCVI